ncbi:hypothetical protein V6Z11_D12G249700 [Gossypium hirsutum]
MLSPPETAMYFGYVVRLFYEINYLAMVAHGSQMATFCTILGLVIEFYTGDSTLQTVVWTVQSGLHFIAFNILLQRNLNKHMQEFREVRTPLSHQSVHA